MSEHRIESRAGVQRVLQQAKRVAVIGIKPEAKAGHAAFYVPQYLQQAGYEVIPVPVYFPEVREILDRPVYRSLGEVPGEIDLVVLFRRPNDVPQHLEDILAKRPRAVWMQSGISHEEVASRLAAEGIDVVEDRCTMIEHRFMR